MADYRRFARSVRRCLIRRTWYTLTIREGCVDEGERKVAQMQDCSRALTTGRGRAFIMRSEVLYERECSRAISLFLYTNKLAKRVRSNSSYTKHASGRHLPRLRKDLVKMTAPSGILPLLMSATARSQPGVASTSFCQLDTA